ncbi:RNA polymerase factor sigma-70 [Blastopirellula marina]|uniref:RNA polymerase factor sigma-70 n=1 Tax=Blastopirellula marina TaxID=124 RepID=A0A2S8F0I5_9BACT|nr:MULTISPECIES: sigma-70 family RNA polymerase sigma factor [Pirellulaceae]PQO25666.1 RNA polymerase factor sigma-70 [Blastopirellula marina]RCS43349.1 RNA polymerase factor sigma-70 [Bremerella cremea]
MLTNEQQMQFTRLWTDAQPVVSHYVESLVSDVWAARDIVQNTSMTLLQKFEQYDPARPFPAWALGIAKFEILSNRRDLARSRIVCDPDLLEQYTAAWVEISPQIGDEALALRQCVSKLQKSQQELLRLRYVENMNSDDIATQFGRTATSIRTTLHRIRQALRRCIEGHLPERGAV